MLTEANENDQQRLAILSLWAIPGLGPKALEALRTRTNGDLCALLSEPAASWASDARLSAEVRQWLDRVPRLSLLGERVMERAQNTEIEIAFKEDPAYPQRLREVEDAPPVLFYCGTPGRARHRVAMVGSRHPENGFLNYAERFAFEVASYGVAILSGAAQGVDRACHSGALAAGGETWAFLGSALDEIDPPQAKLKPEIVDKGGILYTEYPPGVRANSSTFPRRNRLISGSADAVLILRAGERSGGLHTAEAARKQGRPVLALPGDPRNEAAAGCNRLIQIGKAQLCRDPADVMNVLTGKPLGSGQPSGRFDDPPPQPLNLTAEALVAYKLVGSGPVSFEQLLSFKELSSASLTAALCELELMGLVVQHPGKLYERT